MLRCMSRLAGVTARSPARATAAVVVADITTFRDMWARHGFTGAAFLHVRVRPSSASTPGINNSDKKSIMSLRRDTFMAALTHAKRVPIEEGCELLVLPDTASGERVNWLHLNKSNVLFVRPIYKKFYEEVLEAFSDRVIIRRRNKLLRGVPGIGKSAFGQYVLWRLVTEGRSVLYEYPKGLDKDVPISFNGPKHDVYIADGCAPSGSDAATLLISSPCTGVYDGFEEQAFPLYMPTPSPAEILLMRQYCFDVSDPELEVAKVEERMARWGPVPRYVLDQIDKERQRLEQTIAKQRASALHELVRTGDERVALRDVSFRIVHYDISPDFSDVSYRWASPYVARRVAEVLLARQQAADYRSEAMGSGLSIPRTS